MDEAMELLMAFRQRGQETARLSAIRHFAAAAGWEPAAFEEALQMWESIESIHLQETRDRIIFSRRLDTQPVASQQYPQALAVQPPGEGRGVTLLSLFTGMGTDRLMFEELCARHPRLILQDAWFVETNGLLARALQRTWGERFRPLASDAWDLLRNQGDLLSPRFPPDPCSS